MGDEKASLACEVYTEPFGGSDFPLPPGYLDAQNFLPNGFIDPSIKHVRRYSLCKGLPPPSGSCLLRFPPQHTHTALGKIRAQTLSILLQLRKCTQRTGPVGRWGQVGQTRPPIYLSFFLSFFRSVPLGFLEAQTQAHVQTQNGVRVFRYWKGVHVGAARTNWVNGTIRETKTIQSGIAYDDNNRRLATFKAGRVFTGEKKKHFWRNVYFIVYRVAETHFRDEEEPP